MKLEALPTCVVVRLVTKLLGFLPVCALAVVFWGSVAGAAEHGQRFVLVHGAFVGGWYWDPVVDGLREKGHDVVAVDLTGHGNRSAENSRAITITDHIADVVEAIRASDGPVILVAHSYGGRPATGAWDEVRDEVLAVIYLEAVAPYGSGSDAIPEDSRQIMALANRNPGALETGLLQPGDHLFSRYPGKSIVPQSVGALYGRVPLHRGPLPDMPGAYVIGSKSTAMIFQQYAMKVADERGWTIYEIESGHDMVHDAADVVVRLLDKLASELPMSAANIPGHTK